MRAVTDHDRTEIDTLKIEIQTRQSIRVVGIFSLVRIPSILFFRKLACPRNNVLHRFRAHIPLVPEPQQEAGQGGAAGSGQGTVRP